MKALVTGAKGAVGSALCAELKRRHWEVVATDLDTMDVTDAVRTRAVLEQVVPEVVFHLAGSKLAVHGELDPEGFAKVNVQGTANVVRAVKTLGYGKVVFASTCKAADPETAYGASKLIAERIVLNAGGVVLRFFNIPEAGPSVFTLWRSLPGSEPIPWTDCFRYFVPLADSIAFMVDAAKLPWGRYAPDPGERVHMHDLARELYPGRTLVEIPRRRGDRYAEPLCAESEELHRTTGSVYRIIGAHDPEMARLKAAA